jgi:hypothetical protein
MLKASPIFKPSLQSLSYILRHREWWPDGFVWDFKFHTSCACGLAYRLWPQLRLIDLFIRDDDFKHIFIRADTKPPVKVWWLYERTRYHTEVTPDMVADQLDEFLAAHGGVETCHAPSLERVR